MMPRAQTSRVSRRAFTLIELVVATVIVFVFSLSLWLWTTVVNTDHFVDHASSAMQQDDAREALATQIVHGVLKGRPLMQLVIGDQVVNFVDSILDSERFENLFRAVATSIHDQLTSTGKASIVVDVSGLNRTIERVANVLNDGQGEEAADLPNEIVLFESGDFPGLKTFADVTPWVTVVSGLAAAALIGLVLLLADDRRTALRRLGVGLALGAIVVALAMLPLRSASLSRIALEERRIIVAALFDSFARQYLAELIVIFVVGAGLVIGTLVAGNSTKATAS